MKKILKMFLFAFVVLLFGMCVVPDEYSWLSVILYFFVWVIVFLAGQKLILILPENWKWINHSRNRSRLLQPVIRDRIQT